MAIVLDDSSSTGIPLPNWVVTILGVGLILITVWCIAVTAMFIFDVYREYQTRHRRTRFYVVRTSSHLSIPRTERNLQEEGEMRRHEINTADISAIPLPASFLFDQRENKREEGVDVMDDEEGMDTFIRVDSEEEDSPVKAVEIEVHEVTVVPLSEEVEHEMEDVTVVYTEDVDHEEEEREERLATHNKVTLEETNEEDQVDEDEEDEEEDIIATSSNQKGIQLRRPLNIWQLGATIVKPGYLTSEFMQLPSPFVKKDAFQVEVKHKNRYSNVLPTANSRVHLRQLLNQPSSTYINANFIRDYAGHGQRYIATQSPLYQTAADFWRMVWEYKCPVVVMTTLCKENGIEICYKYWKDNTSIVFGGLYVTTRSIKDYDGYTERKIHLYQPGSEELHSLIHYELTFWSRCEATQEITPVIDFLKHVDLHHVNGPVVVHCQTGIGRTAMLICIDQGMQCIDSGADKVDIMSIVSHLRQDRHGSVETADQYRFIYQAIHDHAFSQLYSSQEFV